MATRMKSDIVTRAFPDFKGNSPGNEVGILSLCCKLRMVFSHISKKQKRGETFRIIHLS